MNTVASMILGGLARGSIAMLMVMLLVRTWKMKSPELRRAACVAVLLQGWLLAPWTIEIPWYRAAMLPSIPLAGITDHAAIDLDTTGDFLRHDAGFKEPSLHSNTATAEGSNDRGLQWAIVACWLVGVLCWIGCSGVATLGLWWQSRQWSLASVAWHEPWDRLLREAAVARSIPLYVAQHHGPMLCRLPRFTCLVLPRDYWAALTDAERDTILRHELSHYRHGDLWKSTLVGGLALPYWFHPAAWWSLATFGEASEWRCDAAAAKNAGTQCDYLRALGKLVELRQPSRFVVGQSAHAHPLVLRMRRIADGPLPEESKMKKSLCFTAIAVLLAVQTIRVRLVAEDAAAPPTSVAALQAKMQELDQKIESLSGLEGSMKEHAEELKRTVDAKVEQLQALRESPDQLSAEARRRAQLFMGGLEADQLDALKDIDQHQPRDEAVLFCGYAARQSEYAAVRHAALKAACAMGKEGYPAIAIAYESLGNEDRASLLESMRSFDAADRAVLMALMAKDADESLRDKLIQEPLEDDRRLVLLGALAKSSGDEVIGSILNAAEATEGEQGLAMLYAAAKAKEPEYVLRAVKAARKRGAIAYPVIAAAGKCEDVEVRAEIVRAAKTWGGEVGQLIIQRAKAEPNDELRQAAETAAAE